MDSMANSPAPKQGSGFLTLLKKRQFLYLWLAQLISMTVLNASNYALLVLIEVVTGSTTLVGLALICFSLPALIFGAPAGVFVDRMNKRQVLWLSNCLRAIATFVFVVSLLLNQHQLVPVYLLTFLISTIGQFFSPAEGSTIPQLVSEEELMPALSLFNITFMLSNALGFIIVAPLALSLLPAFHLFHLGVQPIDELYAIIGVSYLVCAVLIALIPKESFAKTARNTNNRHHLDSEETSFAREAMNTLSDVWMEMSQGWSFVRRRKLLFMAVVQLSFAGVLLLVIGELATPIVTKLLGLPAKAMAFIFAPAGIGLVLGSVFMPRITRLLGRSRAILTGSIALTIATLALPLWVVLARYLLPHSWNANPFVLFLVAFIMFCAGVALDFVNIPAQTAMQEQSPDWIKGRVLALQLMLYNGCAIPIILFIGAFADIFGVDRVLYLMSGCSLAFGLWSRFYEHRHEREIAVSNEHGDEERREVDTMV